MACNILYLIVWFALILAQMAITFVKIKCLENREEEKKFLQAAISIFLLLYNIIARDIIVEMDSIKFISIFIVINTIAVSIPYSRDVLAIYKKPELLKTPLTKFLFTIAVILLFIPLFMSFAMDYISMFL